MVDGVVVAACEEERFTRNKRALREAANHSVQACLDTAGLDLADIDCLAVSWVPGLAPHDRRLTDSLDRLTSSDRFLDKRLPEIRYVPHHLAHAALGFHTSGFAEAAVIVADGQGEDVATTVFRAEGSRLVEVARFGIADSLGFFYAAVTRYLGFTAGSAGKTMGLAPYGQITYEFPELATHQDGYRITMPGADKPERMRGWLERLDEVFGLAPQGVPAMDRSTDLLRSPVTLLRHHQEAAASAQAALERILSHVAEIALASTHSRNLVLSGGVALNCSANGRLREQFPSADVFVNGAAHDGGTALGAALLVAAENGELPPPERSRSLFLGPEFDPAPAIAWARRSGLQVETPSAGIGVACARRLDASQVGAWFRGRAEYGPRALGGRSIIARSDSREVADRVNRIKGRECWRPLAPALSASTAEAFGLTGKPLDFMIEAHWITDEALAQPLAGIMHVDRSVRPMVVGEKGHPFSELLAGAAEVSGLGTVTNTSFNLESEPIVNSPIDALRTFVASDLDFLALGEVIISKPS